ncbi:hypothetical protein FGG15_14100 [Flagellimonas algicola]|uniref:Adhesin domain-containing protein n=2 Tax=Flagellimonas algicola TaxID=2583815 RepID=A0ABY2WN49_9FLAO|nr:hypothetical protein FGG15_14100 [Allomuricauda algicola]
MRFPFILLGFLGLSNLHGQKEIKKALLDSDIEFIQINADFCYQITLQTAKTDEVYVAAQMEGEYAKDLLLTLEEKGATMLIGTGFHPNFTNPNDKLSAHKVISIALEIVVPAHRNVSLYGTSSNVDVLGDYEKLEVKLANGTCTLDNVTQFVDVKTQKGDIMVWASQGNFQAESTYGQVVKEEIPIGSNQYILSSVEGTIQLKKTK